MTEFAEVFCPQCGSDEAMPLGRHGSRFWLRCRSCGWDFSPDPLEGVMPDDDDSPE